MLRAAVVAVLALAVPGVQAQQVESRGVPASVLSPTSPGTAHGTPSSVNSPVPANNGLFIAQRRPRVRFGNPRFRHGRRDFVPVPIFVPAYPLADYGYAPADEAAAEQPASAADADTESSGADSDAVREAYYRGAHDALAAAQQRSDSRYGEHYLDSRERTPFTPPSRKSKDADKAQPKDEQQQEDTSASQEPADQGPATVFIFKDGHKLETQNYAIQGQTLFDFSNNQLKKIKIADLDIDATKKANDDLGITLKLPTGTP